jgi:hypothetical protein
VGRRHFPVLLLNRQTPINVQENTGPWRDSIAQAGVFVSSPRAAALLRTTSQLAGERVALDFDSQELYAEYAAVFGGSDPTAIPEAPAAADVIIQLRASTPVTGFGYLHVTRRGRPLPASEYFIGLDRPGCTYREIGSAGNWKAIGEAAGEAIFLIGDEHCFFRLTQEWPITALSLIFRAAFGVREDAMMFHAASISIHGRGFIFAGPRYSGKSTTALTLAARGHQFLSDEIAWFVPSTGQLIDFRRPVGVREGVRSAAIDAIMPSVAGSGIDWHDSLRLPIDSLVPQQQPAQTLLRAVVFLKPFEPRPRLELVKPTREHLPLLQPLPMSMLNTSPARRMMQLIQLLANVRVYELFPGHPDETALILEEAALQCE